MTPRDEFPVHNEIMELLYGKPARPHLPDIISVLTNIQGLDGETLPLLTRLLMTGAANAREEVRKAFGEIVAKFQRAYDETDDSYRHEDGESRWEQFLDGYEHPVIRNNLLGVWNAANVNDESGGSITVDEVIAGMRSIPFYVEEVDPDVDEQAAGDPYWRGLAAVSISRYANHALVTMDSEVLNETVPGFAEWAGNHDDIAKIISVARERGSFDRRMLEEILSEQVGKRVLSGGVL